MYDSYFREVGVEQTTFPHSNTEGPFKQSFCDLMLGGKILEFNLPTTYFSFVKVTLNKSFSHSFT